MNVHHHPVFPSIISEIQCDFYSYIREDLIKLIYEYQENTKGVIISNRGGWQSPDILSLKENPFTLFFDFLQGQLKLVTEIYNIKFQLLNAWININNKNNYNVKHNHPGSLLSGVFWIKCPDDCGELTFTSPNSFVEHSLFDKIDKKIAKDLNYYELFSFNPKEGVLVLFPSHLEHLVEPNQSNEDRISIAFNVGATF
jgi:uncharacterized protein (TIGR02466 family)